MPNDQFDLLNVAWVKPKVDIYLITKVEQLLLRLEVQVLEVVVQPRRLLDRDLVRELDLRVKVGA